VAGQELALPSLRGQVEHPASLAVHGGLGQRRDGQRLVERDLTDCADLPAADALHDSATNDRRTHQCTADG
jgi:hypothetical protein